MIKTLVILLSCTATANACESTDKATMTSVDANANAKRIGLGLGIGGIAGAAVLPTFLLAIGLTPAGPVAGGWFAASQGAGIAAGSWMASWQSMAMFGSLAKSLTVGAGFAATGAGAGALTASKLSSAQDAESGRLGGVRSLTWKLAAYTSDKAAKIYSYASDALKGD